MFWLKFSQSLNFKGSCFIQNLNQIPPPPSPLSLSSLPPFLSKYPEPFLPILCIRLFYNQIKEGTRQHYPQDQGGGIIHENFVQIVSKNTTQTPPYHHSVCKALFARFQNCNHPYPLSSTPSPPLQEMGAFRFFFILFVHPLFIIHERSISFGFFSIVQES